MKFHPDLTVIDDSYIDNMLRKVHYNVLNRDEAIDSYWINSVNVCISRGLLQEQARVDKCISNCHFGDPDCWTIFVFPFEYLLSKSVAKANGVKS